MEVPMRCSETPRSDFQRTILQQTAFIAGFLQDRLPCPETKLFSRDPRFEFSEPPNNYSGFENPAQKRGGCSWNGQRRTNLLGRAVNKELCERLSRLDQDLELTLLLQPAKPDDLPARSKQKLFLRQLLATKFRHRTMIAKKKKKKNYNRRVYLHFGLAGNASQWNSPKRPLFFSPGDCRAQRAVSERLIG